MIEIDTSAEAVERLATEVVSSLPATDEFGAWADPLRAPAVVDALAALDIAATLRALLAERVALLEAAENGAQILWDLGYEHDAEIVRREIAVSAPRRA